MGERLKNIPILFENDHCLVLDKPAGLSVQGGEGIKVSLDSLLTEAFPERPHLVHRLDRDTSGVIIAAKDRAAAVELSQLFSSRRSGLSKRYLAVCAGVPDPTAGNINLNLEAKGRKQEALTRYRTLSESAVSLPQGERLFSLVELEPGTGRMHQIRRHLAQIRCPILGDDKYGDFALNRAFRKALGLRRLLLHARNLVIPPCRALPEGLHIEAPLPDCFAPYLL